MQNKAQKESNLFQKEQEILKFWQENKIFEKSVDKKHPQGEYSFYDGPPFATGLPHYGHIVASLLKDVFPRYKTMQGYQVTRKWGWDCHGLPIESLVEKDLNIKDKADIENKIGIDKFNQACCQKVMKYADEWKKFIPMIGRWVDMENDYKTMDLEYMESVWWVFKQLWDKGLIYEGYKSMHICPHCETTLSNFEVSQGYKDIEDWSVITKFELVDQPNTYLLAWTTTPWTLPGNVALAIGENIDYVKVMVSKENYILAKANLESIFKDVKYEVIEPIKVSDLIRKKYKPLFDFSNQDLEHKENLYTIQSADFVTIEDGTGIVHIAPAFGEDDMNLGQEKKLPFIQHVSFSGHFTESMTNFEDFAGLEVKPKEDTQRTDKKVIDYLKNKDLVFKVEEYEHSYPHCWRCDAPLLNYATGSWFVNVSKIKDKIIKNNKKINWVPKNFKEGRMGKWLEGARDWSISRQRYWGSVLPIWKCACGEIKVMGSISDLQQYSNQPITKLIFIRHGESERNIQNIKSRTIDKFPLTKKGHEEVEKIAKKISDSVDIIISSPILRTKQTAELLQKKIGTDIVYDDLIMEYDHGKWEDVLPDELLKDPSYQKYEELKSPEEKFKFRLGETGETRDEIIKRVGKFINKVFEKYKGKTILIVSHGGIYAAIEKFIYDTSLEDFLNSEEVDHNNMQTLCLGPDGKAMDLHKHYVDKITFKCPKCKKEMKRIPDVFDCWFESGSMPYASIHYPFENKKWFKNNFPADFIAEGQDQTRGWFYTLLVLATALFDQPAFKNVVVNGIVLAEDGQKMSKRLRNYPDPIELIQKYSADVLRYYLLSSSVVKAGDLCFSEKDVATVYSRYFLTLLNVLSFYKMYAQPSDSEFQESKNILDQWILIKLKSLTAEITFNLDNYELKKCLDLIGDFILELSTWYLRRSRDRFKTEDKQAGLTLYHVLFEFSKIIAPFLPFMAEDIYQELKGSSESVHLSAWPEIKDLSSTEKELLVNMQKIREIVEKVHKLRAEAGIKVRQPLALVQYHWGAKAIDKNLEKIIAEELNVKAVEFSKELKDQEVYLNTDLNPELKAEGNLRELIRNINALRKKAGLTIGDKVEIYFQTKDQELISLIQNKFAELAQGVLAIAFKNEELIDSLIEKEFEINEYKIKVFLKKV